MEIEKFNTSRKKFNQMKEMAYVYPEIKEIFEENDYMFDKIQDSVKTIIDDNPAKLIFLKVLPTLGGMNVTRDCYKFLADKFPIERNIAIQRGVKYKRALEETAKRNNDYKNIDALNKALSVIEIET